MATVMLLNLTLVNECMWNRPTSITEHRNQMTSNKYGYHSQKTNDEIIFDDLPFKEETFSQEVTTNGVTDWEVGDICIHQKFGKGVVVSLEGDDIIVVEFPTEGRKTLLGSHKMISKGVK